MLPTGWKKLSLIDVATIQTGIAKGKKGLKNPISVPYLRVANVQDGYLDLSEIKEIKIEPNQLYRYLLKVGDVLLTEGGDFDKLGRGYIWKGQIENCIHQNHVFVVRVLGSELLPYFFSALSSSPYGKSYFLSCSKQSTNLASINSTQLKQFPIILPPLPEQKKIARILSTWDSAIEKLEALIAAKLKRKKALMQQLLTGKKRLKKFQGKEWHIFPLSELLNTISRPIPKPSIQYKAVGIRSHGKGTFQRTIENPETVAMDTLYQVKQNDLIVNITFAWELP